MPAFGMADLKLVSRRDFLQRPQPEYCRLLVRVYTPQSAESVFGHGAAASDGNQLLIAAKTDSSFGGAQVNGCMDRIKPRKWKRRILHVVRISDAILQPPRVGLPINGQDFAWL